MPSSWIGTSILTDETEILNDSGVKIHDLLEQNGFGGDTIEVNETTYPILYSKVTYLYELSVLSFSTVSTINNEEVTVGSKELIVDGVTESVVGNYTELAGTGTAKYMEIDLLEEYTMEGVRVWHWAGEADRVYYGTKVEVSKDGVEWQVVFDSDSQGTYVEEDEGHLVEFTPTSVRYIRDYCNGNSTNDNNHWVEIQAELLSTTKYLPNMTPPEGTTLRYKIIADAT